jgi:hypothetical protein
MFEKLVRPLLTFLFVADFATHQGLLKVIPGSPEGQKPIHEVENPILKRQQK